MRIWKFLLEPHLEQKIRTPAVWRPIHVAEQHGNLFMWAEVELTRATEKDRTIYVIPTGFEVKISGEIDVGPDAEHFGSVVMGNGLVWHVYVERDE